MAKNPEERFTAKQALAHPWITGKPIETMPMTAKEQIKVFDKVQIFSKVLKLIKKSFISVFLIFWFVFFLVLLGLGGFFHNLI